MRVLALALALAVVAAAAGPALAQPTSPHETAATAAFDRGDLATALREFEAAYAETPRPDLLYVIGKLYAARKDCPRAIQHFEKFLATGPGPNATEGARTEINKCERILAAQKPADPPPDQPIDKPADPPPADEPTATAPDVAGAVATPSDRRPRDKLATVLIGGGIAVDLVALLVYRQARGAQCDSVCMGISYDAYQAKEDRASRLRMTAVVFGGVGTIALGVGLYRHFTRPREPRVDVGVVPHDGGGTLVVGGRF